MLDTNADDVIRDIESYEVRFGNAIRGKVAYYTNLIRTKAIDIIKKRDHISSGSLVNAITFEVRRLTDQIVGIVGVNISYAPYVHFGTRPHWPPVAPIRQWVAQQIRRGKINLGPGETVKGRAFLVSRAIARRGTKGTKFFDIALRLYEQKIVAEVAAEIGRLNG